MSDQEKPAPPLKLDIEHAYVPDDPRGWSRSRKNVILVIVSFASLIATLAANVQNPGIKQIEDQLHASSSEISWSLSVFILVQGIGPFLWSAVSEIKGRKLVYLASVALFTIGSVIVAIARSIGLVIGMRCVQGAGGSAVLAIGAATLADIYEPAERGSMVGIYYTAPLLGPALGPILGGALTQAFDWRAAYWLLVIFGGVIFLAFLFFFKDTYRQERSLTYQLVVRRRMREKEIESSKSSSPSNVLPSGDQKSLRGVSETGNDSAEKDLETAVVPQAPAIDEIKLSVKDVNPFGPLWIVLRRWNNITVLVTSALIFGFFYSISYTCARTLGGAPYNFNALDIGLVLLSYGVGAMFGSILGGRWSDRVLARLKAQNDGKSLPEMRLHSTKAAMIFLPLSVIGYAWVCARHVNVAAICVMLFLAGFFALWIYASALAYLVDANTGRSSTSVAANGFFRGIAAFTAAEVAVPLQDAIGDGWMYTLWAVLLVISEVLIIATIWKGGQWRDLAEAREAQSEHR